jgi:processive 1,2-diacylglycerol beta-glucosyltransferase
MSKRILIVTEEWAGSGHRMAALALREAVEKRSAGASVRIVGGLDHASRTLRELSRLFYLNSLRYYPSLWQRLYNRERWLGDRLKKPLGKLLARRLAGTVLEREQPDVVVATHAYCLSALAEAKRTAAKPFRLISIPTDYYVNRFWVHPEIDGYIVAHEQVADQLAARHGVERGKIAVFGIPVRPSFQEAAQRPKAEWKAKVGLQTDRFTVLLCGGEGGYGRLDLVVQALLKISEKLQIVVITGKNEQARAKLQALVSQTIHPHFVTVKGYEPAIWEWIGAADVYVTKPGGISCAEALALRTPLIFYQPLPGQEQYNSNFLQQQQVALYAQRAEEIADIIRRRLGREEAWEDIASRMERISRPDAAVRAADYLLRL